MNTPPPPKRRTRIKQALFGSRKKDKDAASTTTSPPNNPLSVSGPPTISHIPHFLSPSRRKGGEVSSPPRPPNAWILYRRDKMRTLHGVSNATANGPRLFSSSHRSIDKEAASSSNIDTAGGPPVILQAQVSRIVSDMWKNETPFMRAEYARLAQSYKAMHREQFPDYKYSPRRKTKTNVDGGDGDGDDDDDDDTDGHSDRAMRQSARESSPTASKLSRTASLSSRVLSPHTLSSGKTPIGVVQKKIERVKGTGRVHIKEENNGSGDVLLPPSSSPALHRAVSADFLRSVEATKPTSKTRSSTRPPVIDRAELPTPTKRAGRKTQRGVAKTDTDGDHATSDVHDAWQLFGISDRNGRMKQDGGDDEQVEELNEWRVDALATASVRPFDGNTMFAPAWRTTPPTDGFASQQQQQQQLFTASFEGTAPSSSPTDAGLLLTVSDNNVGGEAAAPGSTSACTMIDFAQQAGGAASAPMQYAAFPQPEAGGAAAQVGSASGDFAPYYGRPSSEYRQRLNSLGSFVGSVTSLASAPPFYNLGWETASMRGGGAARGMNGVYPPSAPSSNGSLLSLHSAPAATMPRSSDGHSDYSSSLANFTASLNRFVPGDSSVLSENYVAPSPSDTSSCAASLTNAFAAWPPPSGNAFLASDVSRQGEHYGSRSEMSLAMPSPSDQMASAGFVRTNDDTALPDNSPFVPTQRQSGWSATTEALMTDANGVNINVDVHSSDVWPSQHDHAMAMQHLSYAEHIYAQQVFDERSYATHAPHSAPAMYTRTFPRFDVLPERNDDEAFILRDMQIDQYINGSIHNSNDGR